MLWNERLNSPVSSSPAAVSGRDSSPELPGSEETISPLFSSLKKPRRTIEYLATDKDIEEDKSKHLLFSDMRRW